MVATVVRLKAAASTVSYFEADGYYARGDPAHRAASGWHGAGAAALGLRGPVAPRRFAAVLAGFVPGEDIRLGRLRDGEHRHRPGIDITFSAPKSVSLEALVYAPGRTGARVMRAHDEAARATLDFVEAELLQTRGYDPATGRRPRVAAHGMVAATFRHVASRNLDPQLHTHAVLANMTRDRAGGWRSAEFTSIERSKLLIGACYRDELRRRLEALGYATVPTLVGRVPGFEIAGYSRPLLEAFSTRRRALLSYIEDRGWAYTPAAAQQAALYTRRRKAEPDRRVLAAAWRARALEAGPARDREAARGRDRRGLAERAAARAREARGQPHPSALATVRRAVEHLEERRTVFAANDLRAWALAHGGGRHSLSALDGAIGALRRDGHLVAATARRADLAFVTDRAVAAEREVLAAMRAGVGAGAALAPESEVEAGLAAAGLNDGQAAAARAILLSPHRAVGVQGHAGSGKTTMLRAVASLAGERPVIGLAPSAAAARVLEREAGVPARTLQWFLARYRDVGDGIAPPERMDDAREALGGAILVLDEASMVGTVQMRALGRIAARTGVARLALVGDRRQLRAVDAGQPFGLLQDAGMPTAVMDEVLRQRDAGLKAAVLHLLADEPRLAVEGLGNGVLEAESDELAPMAARLWLDLSPTERAGTAILAPRHAQRLEINEAVREGLAAEGALRGPELEIERYMNLRLTRAQKGEAANYRPGDVAIFHHDVHGVRARAGDAFRVVAVEDGEVTLTGPDGKARRVDPSGYIRYRLDLFETAAMTLRAGDLVRWTRNDAARGLVNGERAEIVSIGRRHVRMRREDGRPIALARDDPQLHHLDHAYSSTVHAAQGATYDRVIAVLDSDRGPLTDQAAFYVELTRAKDNIVLLTDDRDALADALETARGGEASALRAIGEQFAAPAPAETLAPLRGKPAMLAEAERERRRAADRDIAAALSQAAAALRDRARLAGEAGEGAGITIAPGYPDWRERAEAALAGCRTVLDDREYAPRLARHPGATERLGDLSQRLDAALAADRAEIERREERERQRREAAARAEAARRAEEEQRRQREAAERQRREERERAEAMRRAEEERQRRAAADRAIRGALSGLEAAARRRGARETHARKWGTHITLQTGYPEWRANAEAALEAGRAVLDNREHAPRLARQPGAAERMARLSRRLDARLDADRAEIARREEERRQREAAERAEAERRAEEERQRQTQTRPRGRRM